jgi:hypothetical protein
MDYQLLVASEMESFLRVLGTAGPGRMPDPAERALHTQLHQYLQSALDRFDALDSDDERDGFRKALRDFVRLHSLVAQIVAWGDRDLERLYHYGRVLLIRLPGRPQVPVDVGDADLSHDRLDGAHLPEVNLLLPAPASRGGTRWVVPLRLCGICRSARCRCLLSLPTNQTALTPSANPLSKPGLHHSRLPWLSRKSHGEPSRLLRCSAC